MEKNKLDLSKAIFIVDGSSFLYRAYYSIRPLTTPDGTPVQAVYGFCRMIKKLLDQYNPNSLIVAWDSPEKTVRHELYKKYKETRQKAPSDLGLQKKLIKKFVDAIGIVQIEEPKIEADDLMYSMAKELEQEDNTVVLITSDKDLGQALSDKVLMFDPFKESFISKEDLEQKLGFNLEKLPFYYSLIGDSSDNIPGVRGIGPKTAVKLVQDFTSLEDLYNNLDKIEKPRTKELLKESKDNAFLSYELFLLRKYPVYMTEKCCPINKENWFKAGQLFKEWGFKSLLNTIPENKIEDSKVFVSQMNKYTFSLVNTKEELEKVIKEVRQAGCCALDTEGDNLSALKSNLVGISICAKVGQAYYIPVGHKIEEKQLSRNYVLSVLKDILEDKSIEKYLHHAKYDSLVLNKYGVALKGVVFDTMIAANLVVSDGQKIGLKPLSEGYLKEPMLTFSDVVKKNKYKNFSFVPLALATEYAAGDAHQTMQLVSIFKEKLVKESLWDLFKNIEMPLMEILLKMEKFGIEVNVNTLNEVNKEVTKQLEKIKNDIINLAGPDFEEINLNSPKQIAQLLFEHLKLPIIKKSKTGPSTNSEVLRYLSKTHLVPTLIDKYRELFKVKSTYLESLPKYLNPKTNRIHTTLSQTTVTTGRLSSSDPNLQNIPVDSFKIRSAFKAPENYVFISADYSQIELRVLAYLSQDKTLLQAFEQNKDIHTITAAGLFDIPESKVTSEQRNIGKRINFSIIYGLTAHGLSKDLEISYKVAQNYIDKFMAQYPGVINWMEKTVIEAKEKGYVETLWGKRRYIPGINEKNRTVYLFSQRAAINTPVQGTAADLVKLSMIQLDKILSQSNYTANMVLQIHDELLIETKENEANHVSAIIQDTLENIVNWNVPLKVTTRIGKNWQEVTK